jgi:hypothetical protein
MFPIVSRSELLTVREAKVQDAPAFVALFRINLVMFVLSSPDIVMANIRNPL